MLAIAKRLIIIILLLSLSFVVINAQEGDHDGMDMDNMDMEEESSEAFLSNTAILAISVGLGIVTSGAIWVIAKDRMTILHYGINALLVATGVIHVLYTLLEDPLLFLNGVGYLGLAILYLLPISTKQPYKQILNIVTIIYTLITIVGYFVIHLGGHFDLLGLITKAVEILLVVLVVAYMFRKEKNLAQA